MARGQLILDLGKLSQLSSTLRARSPVSAGGSGVSIDNTRTETRMSVVSPDVDQGFWCPEVVG